MSDDVVLRLERPSDHGAVGNLQRIAFDDPDDLPSHQGRGVGTRLITEALTVAEEMAIPLVFLEGDPGYYGPREFDRADLRGFRSLSLRIPEPAFQVALMSAYEPWMTGTLVYSEIFWELGCVGLRADHN